MRPEERDDMATRAEELLNSSTPPKTIDGLMQEGRPKQKEPASQNVTTNFLIGFVAGAIATFLILAVISGIASWFGRYPVFTGGVVSSIIVAVGAIIGGLIKSTK